MNKRKAISKSTRTTVYLMYNGHCAYCGRQIDLKDMQIDSLAERQKQSVPIMSDEEINKMFEEE